MARNYLSLGSGRAKCQLCLEKIAKGTPQINFRGHRDSASYHANSKDCGFPRTKTFIKKNGCPNCQVYDLQNQNDIKSDKTTTSHCRHCLKIISFDAETFETQYAGAGSLMNIGKGTGLGSFSPEELTESSAIHGDFDSASLNYSGNQNLVSRAENDSMKLIGLIGLAGIGLLTFFKK